MRCIFLLAIWLRTWMILTLKLFSNFHALLPPPPQGASKPFASQMPVCTVWKILPSIKSTLTSFKTNLILPKVVKICISLEFKFSCYCLRWWQLPLAWQSLAPSCSDFHFPPSPGSVCPVWEISISAWEIEMTKKDCARRKNRCTGKLKEIWLWNLDPPLLISLVSQEEPLSLCRSLLSVEHRGADLPQPSCFAELQFHYP